MDHPHDSAGFDRLESAFAAFLAYDGDDSPDAHERYLADHEELRDLLAPMLRGDDDAPAPHADGASSATDEAPDAFARGRVVGGDFRIEDELGRGGMGIVWSAWQLSLQRRVALKILPESFSFSPRAIARFRREAAVMAKLDQHPNLVRVFAVGQDGNVLWFAMELVDGPPLHRALPAPRDGEPLDAKAIRRRVDIVRQIAMALQHAHDAGIVHRDVKPANVLLRTDGTAVLTDFGLAREDGLPTMTATGAFAGTPQYVSPEQAEGQRVDARSDVFSLGATLYELLTGSPPFDAPTVNEILQRIRLKDPADPRRAAPEVAGDLAAITLRALEKDPTRRYATATAFAGDLAAFLGGHTVAARPVGTVSRLLRAARREPLKAGLATTLLVATPIITGLGGYLLANRDTIAAGEATLHERELEHHLTRGFAALSALDHGTAVTELSAARELQPDSLEAITGLVIAQTRGKQLDTAREILTSLPPNLRDSAAVERLDAFVRDESDAAAREALGLPAPGTVDELLVAGMLEYDRATRTRDRGDAEDSYRMLSAAIAASPGARLLHHVERAYSAGFSQNEAAIRDAVTSLRALWPDEPYALRAIGYALSFCDAPAALEAFERADVLLPDDPWIVANLGQVHRKLEHFDDAERHLRRAAELRPDHASTLVVLGEFLVARKQTDEGVATLERAASLAAPDEAGPHLALANLHSMRRQLEQAAEHWLRGADADPNHASAQVNAGVTLLQLRRPADAVPYLERATELSPRFFHAWVNLGYARSSTDDVDGAIDAFRAAVALRDDQPSTWMNLGLQLSARGDRADAVDAFDRAVELKPDYARARFEYGVLLTQLERFDDAAPQLRAAMELSDDYAMQLRNAASTDLKRPDRRHRAFLLADLGRERDPDARWAHEVFVEAGRALDRHADVRAELSRWAELREDDVGAWIALAEHCLDESLPAVWRSLDGARAAIAAGRAAAGADEVEAARRLDALGERAGS